MRASRLLQILLLLQNRGRLTAAVLGRELEVTPRTILRDVDALSEAGLPILTHRGSEGGIELGFNYRTRLTGLAEDEAEALAVWLTAVPAELVALGLAGPAARARAKLVESFPDRSRAVMAEAARRFPRLGPEGDHDPRIAAIAHAIRAGLTLRLNTHSFAPVVLRPTALLSGPEGWAVIGAAGSPAIAMADWGCINISRAPLP